MNARLYRGTSLCVAILGLLAGCGSSPLRVKESTDVFTGSRVVESEPIVFRDAHFSSGSAAYLAGVLVRSQAPQASPVYSLKVFCGRNKGRQATIQDGARLELWMDNRRLTYTTRGTAATQTAPGAREKIAPHALFEGIDPDDLKALAQAASARLRIELPDDSISAVLDPAARQRLKEWTSRY